MRTVAGETDGPYVVGAMFTSSYRAKAEQLAASCDKYALPYTLHEVPTVHRSISGHGTDDPAYTKANFIHFLLKSHRKPVLYVDADCEFMAKPELIDELVKSRCDFAIYNWYADECTDCFIPVELDCAGGAPATRGRFIVSWGERSSRATHS